MRSFLLSFLASVFLCSLPVYGQAVLSVGIDIPAVTVNQNTQSYEPLPLKVTATVYNTGQSASQTLSARVVLSPGLALDSSEQHVTIKTPVPAVVQAGDSAKLEWRIVYPAAFTPSNYRVYVWLKSSTNDSSVTSALLTVPPVPRPDFSITPSGIPALTMRTDSLGYDGNPFDVFFRFSNAGGTTADSVTLELQLPPDYELDPSTQDNPMRLQQPLEPQAQGGQRLYLSWKVRYTAATRAPRSDTLHIRARGKDIAGGTVEAVVPTAVSVPGMNPVVDISFRDPGSLQYDSADIYNPLPYPLIMRLTNSSAQWTLLGAVQLDIQGDGWSSADPFGQSLPALAPNSHLEFTWDLDVERRSAPRLLDASVEVTDAEGYAHTGQRTVSVPGKPYALTVRDAQMPDSLARTPDATQLLSRTIPVSFRVRNDTWYNSTLVYSKVQTQGTGISSVPWTEQQHSDFMLAGAESGVIRDTFTVLAALKDRVITMHLLAVSDRGDTARYSGDVRVPGLRPILALERRGPDALRYAPGGTYAPNPFSQEYVLHNRGHVAVRVDSLLLRYPMDGVSTPQPLRRDIGFDLLPGDSLITRWDFTAYVRDTLRRVPMHVTAHVSEEYAVATEHTLEIPALFPIITATVTGPDTLAYDPDSLYAPNPFTRTLRVHNTGTADLQLDSVRLTWDDPLLRAESAVAWTAGAVVRPDSVLSLPFVLRAEAHEQEKEVRLDFTLHHGAGKRDTIAAAVYLPALRPGLDAVVLGNAQLVRDPISIYRPDPFTKTVRVSNSGTADLQLDSIVVTFTDPAITVLGAPTQVLDALIRPGDSEESEWQFHAKPHASSGYALLRFLLYHSGGEMLPLQSEIFIPGEPFSFTIEDADIPDRLIARGDGQGYEGNPVAIRFHVKNTAWFASSLRMLRVRVEGEGAQMLTTQPRDPAIDLNPQATSPVVRDSFFVFPATYDRVLRVYVQVESSRGLGDSTWQDIFVPRVTTTSVAASASPSALALVGPYPNPVSRIGTGVVHATVRSHANFRWEVYDMLGRLRASSETLPPSDGRRVVRIPLRGMAQGSYLLRIVTAEAQVSTRFVIFD
jgi:hypothetical protein